jgi:hypothetical protein
MTNGEAPAIIKVASAAQVGGPIVSVTSGAATFLGFTAGEWQVIGIVGGLLVGVLGFLVNWGYKHAHWKLARDGAIKAGLTE